MLEALDEPTPTIRKGPSFASQLAALKPGETACRAKRMLLNSDEASNLSEFMRKYRLGIDSQVSRERKESFRDFIVEQGTIITGTGHAIAVVAVTRTS